MRSLQCPLKFVLLCSYVVTTLEDKAAGLLIYLGRYQWMFPVGLPTLQKMVPGTGLSCCVQLCFFPAAVVYCVLYIIGMQRITVSNTHSVVEHETYETMQPLVAGIYIYIA